ncbi:MAG TPA: ATP-binding protein [Polyangiaceae bacterium]|nr:ATP-binding protein [Polyangiaceae bacterium]
MTLAQRLLLAIAAVTVVTAALAGLAVREAWRAAEEERFAQEFRDAKRLLARELGAEPAAIAGLIEPVCEHDPIVDSALVGLRAGDLGDRRLPISLRVPELGRALEMDELVLVTSADEVLGALGERPGPAREREIVARVAHGGPATVRTTPSLAFEFGCRRGDTGTWVGLYAARRLDPLLARVGDAYDLTLARGAPSTSRRVLSEAVDLPELGGVAISASRPRLKLVAALERLDVKLFAIGGVALAGAAVFAFLLARGLARPIVAMSRQAREVAGGEPKPVPAGGGKELVEFANAFNQAIADLTRLRKRLAVTERIAARREIARRVAHEIKNPLAPIRAAIETLRRLRARGDAAFDDYFDEATRTVLDEVLRISNIVSEFTRFARLPPPSPGAMDLAEVARSVVALHANQGAPVVLAGAARAELVADRDQMIQVLTNLVQNALDAVKGRADPRVVVEVALAGDRVRVAVRDNGPGFTPEVAQRLFEPYLTTKPEGTGLGLAIVERIVVEHGGDIVLERAPEGGAALVVSLPLAGPTLLPDSAAPPSSEPEGLAGR